MDYCDWLPSIPPHFPSFPLSSSPVALTLHDFVPRSLKALSLWRTHLTRGESLKSLLTLYPPFCLCLSLFDCLFYHSSSVYTPPLTDLSGLIPPSAAAPRVLLWCFDAQSTASEFGGPWPSRPRAAPLCSNCLSLMAFYYSNHHCHLEISRRTAIWGPQKKKKQRPENLNTYDEQIKSSYLLKEEQHSKNWKRRWCIWDFERCTRVVLFMINAALLITLTLSLTSCFDGDLLGPVSCLRVARRGFTELC